MKTLKTVTTIKQTSRSVARNTVKQLKANNKKAKLVDNGSHLQGSDRWCVKIVAVKLLTPAKPKRVTLAGFKETTALKARTSLNWHKDQVLGGVPVYTRKKHSYDLNFVSI